MPRRAWIALFFLVLPMVVLWPCLLRGETIGAFDQIRTMAPWNGPVPERPWDVLQADGVLQFYGWRDLVLESWGRRELPAWNPYQLGGAPLLANSQSGALYPPHVLLGLLRVPTPIGVAVLAWLHLALAGWGVYVLSRRIGAERPGALVAGGTFALSAFMVAWTSLPSVVSTCAWIPWALAATVSLRKGFLPSRVAGLAAATAMALLAGHLQFAAYLVLGVALAATIGLWTASSPWRSRAAGVGGAALGLALGFALAAPHLLPVLDYSRDSHRRGSPTPQGYQAYAASAILPGQAIARLAVPQALGEPWRPSALEGASTYWPAFAKRGENYAESATTVGPLALGLLALGLLGAMRRETLVWLIVGLVGLLLALGSPLGRLLYFGVPGWSSTGSPGRAIVLFVLAACVAASLGMRAGATLEARRLTFPIAVVAAAMGGMAFFSFPPAAPAGFDESAWSIFSTVPVDALPGWVAAFACLAFVAVLGLRDDPRWRRAAVFIPPVLALVGGLGNAVPTGRPLDKVAGPPAERIAVVNQDWELVLAAPAALPPNTATLSRVHDIGGYDSLMHRESKRILDEISGGDSAPPANGNIAFVKPTLDPAKLAEAGVTEVWSRRPIEGLGPARPGPGGLIAYRLAGPGRVSSSDGEARIVSEGLGRLTVEGRGPGPVTLRERAMEGWRTSTGRLERTPDGRWLVLAGMGAGPWKADLRYEPPGLRIGLWCALGGTTVLAMLGIWQKRRYNGERVADPR